MMIYLVDGLTRNSWASQNLTGGSRLCFKATICNCLVKDIWVSFRLSNVETLDVTHSSNICYASLVALIHGAALRESPGLMDHFKNTFQTNHQEHNLLHFIQNILFTGNIHNTDVSILHEAFNLSYFNLSTSSSFFSHLSLHLQQKTVTCRWKLTSDQISSSQSCRCSGFIWTFINSYVCSCTF